MKEPVDHIIRPTLPWRKAGEGSITECGFDASKVKTLTRPEYFQRRKDLGQQRCAMMTCMTCADTAARWGTWEDDPRRAVEREIEWECMGRWSGQQRGTRLKDELIAIAALLEGHRDEFEAIIAENVQRRDWLEKKAALASKPKQPKGTMGR